MKATLRNPRRIGRRAIDRPPGTRQPLPVTLIVHDERDAAAARRAAMSLGLEGGLGRVAACYLATAVSELAHNLVFHAHPGGRLSLLPLYDDGRVGVEVRAEDDGPGIADLELALRDGYSSNGGLGSGLPGVRRLMDEFEIHSTPGRATWVRARKWQTWTWPG